MRLVHTADFHLGTELYGHPDPLSGMSTRGQDFLQAFDQVVDGAIQQGADAFLFAGDAYKSRDPNPTYQRAFAQRLARLRGAGIPVVLLTGNHDMPNMSVKATSLDVFAALDVAGVLVCNKPRLYTIETRTAGPLQVIAIPWMGRTSLLNMDLYKNSTPEEINKTMLELLDHSIARHLSRLNPTYPTVLMLHGTISNATFSSERSTMLGSDLSIPTSYLRDSRLSYVALGHIHKYQKVSDDPPAYYSGSLERLDFGEEKDPKGYMVVDVPGPGQFAVARFVPVEVRAFVTVDVRNTDADPVQETLAEVERMVQRRQNVDGAVLRVRVQLTTANEAAFQEGAVRRGLEPYRFSHVQIQRQVEHGEMEGRSSLTTAMTPLDALERWMASTNVANARRELLRERTHLLLQELSASE